jgi:hypothetical protein
MNSIGARREILKEAKRYSFELLKYNGNRKLSILCKDSCSEVSRLLAVWFRGKKPMAKIYIAKGKIEKVFHDLILIDVGNSVYIVDPTVWQFFKNKRFILMGAADSINEALNKTAVIYSGKWKISEKVGTYSKKEIRNLKQLLARQIS